MRPENAEWNKITSVEAVNGAFIYNWTASAIGNFEIKANCTEAESNIEELIITKKRTELTITVAPTLAELNSRIRIYGKIDLQSEVSITIYYKKIGHEEQILTNITSDQEGNYKYEWLAKSTGTYEIFSYWSGNETFYPIRSQAKTVVIEKYSTTISLNAHPSPATLNSTVLINGTLKPARPNLKITIFYKEINSSIWSKMTATTDSSGNFAVNWTPPKNATFELYAWWKGDDYSKPCSSNLIYLKVNKPSVQPAPKTTEYIPYIVLIVVAIGISAGVLYIKKSKKRR